MIWARHKQEGSADHEQRREESEEKVKSDVFKLNNSSNKNKRWGCNSKTPLKHALRLSS